MLSSECNIFELYIHSYCEISTISKLTPKTVVTDKKYQFYEDSMQASVIASPV